MYIGNMNSIGEQCFTTTTALYKTLFNPPSLPSNNTARRWEINMDGESLRTVRVLLKYEPCTRLANVHVVLMRFALSRRSVASAGVFGTSGFAESSWQGALAMLSHSGERIG